MQRLFFILPLLYSSDRLTITFRLMTFVYNILYGNMCPIKAAISYYVFNRTERALRALSTPDGTTTAL